MAAVEVGVSTYIGYGREVEIDLHALLGTGYWNYDLNICGHFPFIEYPNLHAMQIEKIGRKCIVLEGTDERMRPYQEAIAEVATREQRDDHS